MTKLQRFWNYWAKAIGAKAEPGCNKTSDKVALIRTIITFQLLITNFFIIAGNIYNFTRTPSVVIINENGEVINVK